jgi:hypothetical protein
MASRGILAVLALASLGLACGDSAPAGPPARIAASEIEAELEARRAAREAQALVPAAPVQAHVPAAASGSLTEPLPESGEPPADELMVGSRLLDDEARPLVGGTLAWLVQGPEGLLVVAREAQSALTGAVWLELPRAELPAAGPLLLAAGGPGRMRTFVLVEHARWAGVDSLGLDELPLRPGGDVSGEVRDEHGAPLAGVFVGLAPELGPLTPELEMEARLWPTIPDLGLGAVPPLVKTDSDGRFVLAGMPVGRFAVVATVLVPGASPRLADREEGVLVRAGEETRVRTLVLREPRAAEVFAGVVLAPGDQPVENADIVLEEDGVARGTPARTSATGRFALLAAEGRRFTLVVRDLASRWEPVRLEGVSPGGGDVVVRLGTER